MLLTQKKWGKDRKLILNKNFEEKKPKTLVIVS